VAKGDPLRLQDIRLIYDYNYWATRQLLTAAEKLTLEQFLSPAAFPYGGLRGTLVHIMDAEHGWRMLFQQTGDKSRMEVRWLAEDMIETDFPTLDSLEIHWLDEEAGMRAYLAGLKEDDLAATIQWTNPDGAKRERVLWHCLFHVLNHGTQHRSEAAAILTDLGQSPGDVDFTFFLHGTQTA
jgi:uncharacterized damage-inducible protein DinB